MSKIESRHRTRRRWRAIAGAAAGLLLVASVTAPMAQNLTPAELKAKEEAKKKADAEKTKARSQSPPQGQPAKTGQPPAKIDPSRAPVTTIKPVERPKTAAPITTKPVEPPKITTPTTSKSVEPPKTTVTTPTAKTVDPKPPSAPTGLKVTPADSTAKPATQQPAAPTGLKVTPADTTQKSATQQPAAPTGLKVTPADTTQKSATQQQAKPAATGTPATPTAQPVKLDDVKQSRSQQVVSGNNVVIKEAGNRTIVKQQNNFFIRNDDSARFQRYAPNAVSNRRGDGTTETIYVRPDGVRIVSVVDGSGRVLRRTKRYPGGHEIVLIDDRAFYRRAAVVGGVALGLGIAAVVLSRPAIAIPRERYIVEYERASDDDIYEAFSAPPIERLSRGYSLDEIRYSDTLRDRMRRVDLDVTFATGSWEVTPEQEGRLERMARAIDRVLRANPDEMFLIEGHTDAIGSPEDNLSLSDRRAEAVAEVLSLRYAIPTENLVTQGYGEQFPKVETREAERLNRRVAVRRIGPLMARGG